MVHGEHNLIVAHREHSLIAAGRIYSLIAAAGMYSLIVAGGARSSAAYNRFALFPRVVVARIVVLMDLSAVVAPAEERRSTQA